MLCAIVAVRPQPTLLVPDFLVRTAQSSRLALTGVEFVDHSVSTATSAGRSQALEGGLQPASASHCS